MASVKRYDDAAQRAFLAGAKVIAVVGHSDNPERTSYQIGRFLKSVGYTVYPVNPAIESVDGDKAYATLADVPEPIDIVDVFRRSEYLAEVVDEAITVGAKVVWAQLGVSDPAAAQAGEDAG
ncbi:MAG: CoA-binding protein, partial [Anaerolineae bacterium]|nr:CoA-binding protein [Anaerolineae bacterium]